MANTYSQAYFHLVFVVRNRLHFISKKWKDELEKYITTVIQNNGHKLLAIGAMPDHIHIFIGYNLNERIPDLVNEIKTSSTKWINNQKTSPYKFQWQIGYGAFTCGHSQIDWVVKYILNQEEHHKKKSFKKEYLTLLKKYEIEFKDEYVFEFFED
jgi:putative transposase